MQLRYRHTFEDGSNEWEYMDLPQTDRASAVAAAWDLVVKLEREYEVCGDYRGVEAHIVFPLEEYE